MAAAPSEAPIPLAQNLAEARVGVAAGNLRRLHDTVSRPLDPAVASDLLACAVYAPRRYAEGARQCWDWLLAQGADPHACLNVEHAHRRGSARMRPPQDPSLTPHNAAVARGKVGWIAGLPPLDTDRWVDSLVVAIEHDSDAGYNHLWRKCPLPRPQAAQILREKIWPVAAGIPIPDASGQVSILDLAMPGADLKLLSEAVWIRRIVRDNLTDVAMRTRFALRLLEGGGTVLQGVLVEAMKGLDAAGLDWNAPHARMDFQFTTLTAQLESAAQDSSLLQDYWAERCAKASVLALRGVLDGLASPQTSRPRL